MNKQTPFSRRQIVSLLLAAPFAFTFAGCEKHFTRSDEFVDLGKVEDLLFPVQHNTTNSMLVTLDEQGWSAMSTRCSREGCGLSFHEGNLLCSCCRSVFDLTGAVLKGPAKNPLPWSTISFENGHLFAHPNKPVDATYRFMTPRIQDSIKLLFESVKEFGYPEPRKLPQILLGKDSGVAGPMFVEPHPDAELEAEFERLKRKNRSRNR